MFSVKHTVRESKVWCTRGQSWPRPEHVAQPAAASAGHGPAIILVCKGLSSPLQRLDFLLQCQVLTPNHQCLHLLDF